MTKSWQHPAFPQEETMKRFASILALLVALTTVAFAQNTNAPGRNLVEGLQAEQILRATFGRVTSPIVRVFVRELGAKANEMRQ